MRTSFSFTRLSDAKKKSSKSEKKKNSPPKIIRAPKGLVEEWRFAKKHQHGLNMVRDVHEYSFDSMGPKNENTKASISIWPVD